MSNNFKLINNLKQNQYKLLSSRLLINFSTYNEYENINLFKIIIKNSFNFIKIFLRININFFKSFIKTSKKKYNFNKDNLIISHYDIENKLDYIFGNNFSQKFEKNSFSIYVTYLDKVSKVSKVSHVFFKYNYFQQLKILFDLYFISFKILSNKSFRNFNNNYYKHLSISYLHYDTFCNLLIFKYLKKNIIDYKFQNILTTFEGHPWEILLFSYLNRNRISKSYAYLHTFLKKNFVYNHLNSIYQPDFIYTVGKIMTNSVINNLKFTNDNVKILGSKKFFINQEFEMFIPKSNYRNILLLPESIDEEVSFFFKFIDLFKDSNFFNIKIKFHPLYKIKLNDFQKYNEFVTKDNLKDLIEKTDIVIYRGTSSVFEIINENIILFYLSKKNEVSRDPLYEYNKKFIVKLNNKNEFLKIIGELTYRQTLIKEYDSFRKSFYNYYEPFKAENLP